MWYFWCSLAYFQQHFHNIPTRITEYGKMYSSIKVLNNVCIDNTEILKIAAIHFDFGLALNSC